MSVVLEPPLTRSGTWRPPGCPPDRPLLTAPAYMRSSYQRLGMPGRWHRIRSGMVHGLFGHTSYTMWCRQSGSSGRGWVTADELPAGDPVCGTCEGRSVGAGQDMWAEGPDLLFSPHRLIRPAKCPGSRSERLYERAGVSVLRCLACGELVRGLCSGGPYNPRYGPAKHEPGRNLVPGCPFHAWSALTVADGRAVCACRLEAEAA